MSEDVAVAVVEEIVVVETETADVIVAESTAAGEVAVDTQTLFVVSEETETIVADDAGTPLNVASYVSAGVNAYQVVCLTNTGRVQAASADNATHAGRIVGLAQTDAAAGDHVTVRRVGSVVNPTWTLTPGAIYYLQAGGEIGTGTGQAFVQKIGVAESATSLFLQIESPIITGG